MKSLFLIISIVSFLFSCENHPSQKESLTKQFDEIVIKNSTESLAELKNGNRRFLKGEAIHSNYHEQIEQTKHGHEPHAVILSCMDSRVPPEIVFDQGIGNIFVIRNVGNLEDHNVLESLEYTVHHSTTKLIVVMGHSHCGAVTGAVKDIKHGHLSQLVEQIKPSIKTDKSHPHVINQTAKHSVDYTINDIMGRSKTIRDMVKEKKISIVGAYYDVETGKVIFL